jgi:hypothetical protein
MKSILTIQIILTITLITSNALAFRCGNEIISTWDKGGSAQIKCGAPFQTSTGTENVRGITQYVEKQFYNCGENDFIYEVSIYNGTIVKIDPIKRGTGKGQCK